MTWRAPPLSRRLVPIVLVLALAGCSVLRGAGAPQLYRVTSNSKAISAIGRESVGLRADFILRTELRHFEAVYDSPNGPPEIWVVISVRLVNPAGRDIVAQTSFERRERASANDMQSIVSAFDDALGGVMKEIVVWTVTNPALSGKRS